MYIRSAVSKMNRVKLHVAWLSLFSEPADTRAVSGLLNLNGEVLN